MKTLFFLVVIANVALFMWEYKTGAFAPVIETTAQNTDLDQEQILLVSELKNIPQPIIPAPVSEPPVAETALIEDTGAVNEVLPSASESIDESAPKNTVAETAMRCYEAGPFANNKTYQAWTNRLKDIDGEIKPVSRDEQIASSYIVYYPAAESAAQSEADMQMLKNHGIKDPWLLTTGEDKDNISLGVFSTETSALTMKSELLAKGIKAEVKVRYKIKPRKYALIKGDGNVTERLDALKKTYPQLTVKQIPNATQGCW